MEANLPQVICGICSLIALNNKRFNHYTKVADKSKQIELKLLFMKYAVQSQLFNNYLNRWLMAYDTAFFSMNKSSRLNRLWNRIKAVFTSDLRSLILNESDSLEREAIKKYKKLLTSHFFPAETLTDLRKQADEIELYYADLKELRTNATSRLQVA
jgi:hypothetical protein